MPCAPNRSQSFANCSTSGTLPPRALRNVATLLIFTLNRVIRLFSLIRLIREHQNAYTQNRLQRYKKNPKYANNSGFFCKKNVTWGTLAVLGDFFALFYGVVCHLPVGECGDVGQQGVGDLLMTEVVRMPAGAHVLVGVQVYAFVKSGGIDVL